MYTEQITLVIGSEYARSQVAADTYAKLTAAEERRHELSAHRSHPGRLARLLRQPRLSAARLLHLH